MICISRFIGIIYIYIKICILHLSKYSIYNQHRFTCITYIISMHIVIIIKLMLTGRKIRTDPVKEGFFKIKDSESVTLNEKQECSTNGVRDFLVQGSARMTASLCCL